MIGSKSIAAVALAWCATATMPALAITNNWIDDNEHPYVGLVVFYDSDGEFSHRCSGSLISPTKFVTAGHCTDATSGAVSARVYFQQDAGANFDPATGVDPVTGYPETCAGGTLGTLCATSSKLFNFGFDNFAGFPDTHDAGVVILDQPIAMPEYGQLPTAGCARWPRQGARHEKHGVHRQRLRADLEREPEFRRFQHLVPLAPDGEVDPCESRQPKQRRLQRADAGERPISRRHMLGRLRRPRISRRIQFEPDRRRDVVRVERALPRDRLRLPHRPAGSPRLDQQPELEPVSSFPSPCPLPREQERGCTADECAHGCEWWPRDESNHSGSNPPARDAWFVLHAHACACVVTNRFGCGDARERTSPARPSSS